MYGNKFADMWAGIELADVKKCWADELRIFSVDQVGKAVDGLKLNNFPPTLPEFLQLCIQARREAPRSYEHRPALPDIQGEEISAARERCMEAIRGLTFGKPSKDWATRIIERAGDGEWDFQRAGHIPIKMAEQCLRGIE